VGPLALVVGRSTHTGLHTRDEASGSHGAASRFVSTTPVLARSLRSWLSGLEPPLRAVESDSNGGQLVVPSTELAAWCEGPQGAEWERRARMQSQHRIQSQSK
jgi:hypothetical protein